MDIVPIDEIVIDLEIYPRSEWSSATIARYAESIEAGENLPPIVLERESRKLLDGMHRYRAYRQLGIHEIEAEYHRIPESVPAKLYAASLSTRHGDRISGVDLREVARETIKSNPDFSMQTIAQLLGVTRQTVGRWVSDITERRREVRKVRALLLSRAGWSTREIERYLGVGHATVVEDVKADISDHLTEDLLREALEGLPEECAEVAEQLREEQIFASWSGEERDLLEQLRRGETVVLNMHADGHPNLTAWAKDAGLFVRIDRQTEWGNPFELGKDGDRETVVDNYDRHYIPYKPSLLSRLHELQGKALGCWCAPKLCHGHVLKTRAGR